MRRFLYSIFGFPFYMTGKIAGFIIWDILSSETSRSKNIRTPRTNQEASNYIQYLLKELRDQKKRADDLHDYYGRQLKNKDLEFTKKIRLN